MSQVEEIKARVDIVDLVGEYIRVKPAGPNNFKALCPFHNEKTPSFMVSRDKQIWHCFGCSEGGDIFSFIQKMEGVEFPEALRILAAKAGVKLVEQNPELFSQRTKLMDVCQWAAYYWHKTLLESSAGQKARDYLRRRRVKDQTIIDFKIGYAAESWDGLIKFLKSKKFTDQEIFLAGLSVKKDRGDGFYDRFRDRVMFPINDLHGSPIGFSGRTLKADEQGGKYINTPQTLIYNKSLVLFNLDKAKSEIKKKDLAVIVEGQMDAISAYEAGTQNVIASSGTALTLDQIKILKRYTRNLAMAFDTDLAGESAAKRGIDLALGEEMNVKVILLSTGKDPDECIKTDAKLWFGAIDNAKSIMDYYFDQTLGRLNLSKPEDKKEAARILLPIIGKIGSQIERTHWLQRLASNLNVPEQILYEMLANKIVKRPLVSQSVTAPASKSRDLMLQEQILGISLKYPELIHYLVGNLLPEVISDSNLHSLYKKVIIYYTENINHHSDPFDYQEFYSQINDQALTQLADQVILQTEKDFFDFELENVRAELEKAIIYAKQNFYRRQLERLLEKMRQAENSGQKELLAELTDESDKILNQINLLA